MSITQKNLSQAEIDQRKAAHAAERTAREAYETAKQARKDVFNGLDANKPLTVGDLRQILIEAGLL